MYVLQCCFEPCSVVAAKLSHQVLHVEVLQVLATLRHDLHPNLLGLNASQVVADQVLAALLLSSDERGMLAVDVATLRILSAVRYMRMGILPAVF
jgi:hypothetical protein